MRFADRLCGVFASAAVLGTLMAPALTARADSPNAYHEYGVGISGGEPSIGFDPNANAAMYGAGTNVKRLTWDDGQNPATMTVVDVKPATAKTTLDAITIVDQLTHRSFNSQLAGGCSLTSFSDDAGTTWTPSQGCGANTLLDHQTLGSGPFHAPLPATLNGNNGVYYCAQNGFNENCAVSFDGGLSFGAGTTIDNSPSNDTGDPNPVFAAAGGACTGLSGHVRVAPNGTAYVPLKGCGGAPTTSSPTNYEFFGGTPALSVSIDNGTTWTIRMVPGGHNPDETDPSVAIGKNNTVYFGWEDATNIDEFHNASTRKAMIAVSHDNGTTFLPQVDVTPPGINNVMFPEVIAGDDNRAAFAFLGSTGIGDTQTNGFPQANAGQTIGSSKWDMFIATTYDGGATWTTVDATPGNPVQRGCIDMQGTPTPPQRTNVCSQRNLLDFNDITLDKQGRVVVAYAKGCTGACVTAPESLTTSTDRADMVLRQSYGKGLYAAFDGTLPGSGIGPVIPEAPLAALLPAGALAMVATVGLARRRRRAAGSGAS